MPAVPGMVFDARRAWYSEPRFRPP